MDFWTNINENYIFFSFILQPVWGGMDFWTNINEKYFFSSFILQPVWGGMDFWTNIKGFFFPLHVFAQLVFISLIAFPMTGSRKWIAVCTYTHCWVFIFFTYTPDVYYSDPEHKQHLVSDMHIKRSLYARPCHVTGASNLFSTAVPIWGQTTQIPSGLSQKRDCSSKWVNVSYHRVHTSTYVRTCSHFSSAAPAVHNTGKISLASCTSAPWRQPRAKIRPPNPSLETPKQQNYRQFSFQFLFLFRAKISPTSPPKIIFLNSFCRMYIPTSIELLNCGTFFFPLLLKLKYFVVYYH